MKASRSITLTLLATASAVSLLACDDKSEDASAQRQDPPAAVALADPGADEMFPSETACAEHQDADACRQAVQEAEA